MIHAVQLDLGHIEGTGNRCGVGTGRYDLVIPDPNLEAAQMKPRHTARVQRPSGQTPEAIRPDSG